MMYPPCLVMPFLGAGVGGHINPSAPFMFLPPPSGRKGRDFMRKFKTAEKNRTNYVYYTAEDKKIVLTPEDVDSDWIAFLHGEDDDSVDADRREDYHVPVHYDAYSDGEDSDTADHNAYLKDDAPDPFESLIQSMDEAEHEDKLKRVKVAIQTLQPQQITLIHKVFYENRTNVDIAAEEGVTEAAIRNRLKKIYTNLAKKI
jgi:hypothetical protein